MLAHNTLIFFFHSILIDHLLFYPMLLKIAHSLLFLLPYKHIFSTTITITKNNFTYYTGLVGICLYFFVLNFTVPTFLYICYNKIITTEKEKYQMEKYMNIAYANAQKAFELNEVPIGCVIVYKENIISQAYNQRNTQKNALYHAEILAIDEACKYIGDWRLEDCTMYVTIEPCPMCAGAILQARIPRLVYGARNPKAGSVVSLNSILQGEGYNHQTEITGGVMEDECAKIMSDFFSALRKK